MGLHRRPNIYVKDGQSLMLNPDEGNLAAGILAGRPGHYHHTIAVGGTGYSNRNTYNRRRYTDPVHSVSGFKVLIDVGGTTDVELTSDPATTFAAAQTYWSNRRDDGYDFIIAATVPDSSIYDGTEDGYRATWNDLVEAEVGGRLDGIIDFRLDADLEDWTSGALENDYPGPEDDVYTHPTAETATGMMTRRVLAVLDSLGV